MNQVFIRSERKLKLFPREAGGFMYMKLVMKLFSWLLLFTITACARTGTEIPVVDITEPLESTNPIASIQATPDTELVSTSALPALPTDLVSSETSSEKSIFPPSTATLTSTITTNNTDNTLFTYNMGLKYSGHRPVRIASLEEAEQLAQNWNGYYPHYAGEPFHDGLAVGPGDALLLTFANYTNKVAYWTGNEKGQLWISDLELENPQLVYTDETQIYETNEDSLYSWFGNGDLIWSADDLHLIFDPKDETLPNLIYHLQNDSVEEWPWYCDRVALSPQTGRLATWCAALDDSSNFAVMEWGGEIWISSSPPKQNIVRQTSERALLWEYIWAWSSDGQQIAYFDPADTKGRLFIANSEGIQQELFTGSAWWLNSNTSNIGLPQHIIHWTPDGQRLLVYANELSPNACSEYIFPFQEDMAVELPCWHLLTAPDYSLIWSWNDFIVASKVPSELTKHWRAVEASISPDGDYLALRMVLDDNKVSSGIARLPEKDVMILANSDFETFRWYNK